jgi:hypothetical protein
MVIEAGCTIVTLEKYVMAIHKKFIWPYLIGRKELGTSLGCYMLPLGICVIDVIYGPIKNLLEESDVSLGWVFNCLLSMTHPFVFSVYCVIVLLISFICARFRRSNGIAWLWLLRSLSILAVLALLYFLAMFSTVLWPWSFFTRWIWSLS